MSRDCKPERSEIFLFYFIILKAVLFEKFVYKRELEEHQKSLEMSGYIEGMVVVDLSCG